MKYFSDYEISKLDDKKYCVSNGQFSRHLKSYGYTFQKYVEEFIISAERCPYCNTRSKRMNRDLSYQKTCGNNTCLTKHKSKIVNREASSDSAKKWWSSVDHKEIGRKIKEGKMNRTKRFTRYVRFDLLTPEEKKKLTCIKKYGVDHYSKTSEFKEKYKKQMLEKYSVDHYFKSLEFKDIIKCNHPMRNYAIRDKVSKTHIEKYGCKRKSMSHVNYGVLLNGPLLEIIYEKEGIDGICKRANVVPSTALKYLHLNDIDIVRKCYSKFEKEVLQFVVDNLPNGTVIKENSRKIISPYELDICIVDYNFAIECNGRYWHSEKFAKGDEYHEMKEDMCREKNIELLFVWDDEWNNDKDSTKEKILKMINKCKNNNKLLGD